MNMGKKITELDHAASVPAGTSFVAEMGDGTGTKHITQEDLIKAVGDSLPLGNIKELLTDDKSSFVSAINEIQQMFALMGIRYWGEYNQDRTYKKMDAVYYDGSTYIALKDNPAGPPVADVANWQYLAKGFMDGYLIAKSQIVNNLLATVPGNVLDAVQGKALADMINGINSNLHSKIVFKMYSMEFELIANKMTVIDIPITEMEGYTPYCINFCAFTGYAVSTCLSTGTGAVRGTVLSTVSGTYPIRAQVMYVKS